MATEQLVIQVSEKGTLVVKRNLDGLGKSAQKAGGGVKLLRTALGALAAVGIAQGIAQGTRLLADFAQTMSTVEGVANATEQQFGALRDEAKRLGETTRFSANEAAEGMLFLSRAGFTAEESMASIGDTLKLAQVGALDLGTAADIASNVLAGFRGDTSQLSAIIDVMAKAANSSNTNIQQLGQGMKFVAPVAAGLGVSIEETSAAIGTLSDAGLQATLAGTGLRKILATLERPTGAASKVLRELGVSAAEVEVSQVGLAASLQVLKDAGIQTGQALALFGQRGGPAFDVLVNMIPELEEFTEKLQGSAGEADRVAAIMDDNLNGSLLKVRSAFQAIILEFGDLGAVLGLRKALEGLANTLRFVAANLDKFRNALIPVGIALFHFFGPAAILKINLAIKGLWAVMAANPFAVLIIAITAAVAAIVIFSDKINLAGEGTATLADVASIAAKALQELFVSTGDGFGLMGEGAFSAAALIGQAFFALVLTVADIMDVLVGTVLGVFGVLAIGFTQGTAVLGDIWNVAVLFWVDLVEKGVNKIIDGINKVAGFLNLALVPKIEFDLPVNQLAGKSQAFGEEAGEVWGAAFGNVARNAVEGVLDEATGLALARQAEATAKVVARGAAAGAADATGGGGGGGIKFLNIGLPPGFDIEFEKYAGLLRQENKLLKLNSAQREVREGLLEAESSLSRELTDAETKQLETLLVANQQLALQADILQQVRGPQEAYEASLAAIEALKPQLTAEEYANALKLISTTLEETAKGQQALEQGIGSTFDAGTDQLKEFTEGGKVEFKEFARSAVSSIQEIISAMTRAQTIGFIKSVLPAFATGGSFEVGGSGGTDSQLVAFRATPRERVDVSTPGQQRARAPMGVTAPAPKFKIVNILDPNEIRSAMADEEGTKVIMNQLSRNKTTARQVLS